MEYENKEMCYVFEGGILNLEIPYKNKIDVNLENINPAQTEHSLLVKAAVKTRE